jgi:hypothetical protein
VIAKTTAIQALSQELTTGGRYAALAFTCEHGKVAGDNYGAAERVILQEIRETAGFALPPDLQPPPWPEAPDGSLLKAALTEWAQACPGRWCCSSTRSTPYSARAQLACSASSGPGTVGAAWHPRLGGVV